MFGIGGGIIAGPLSRLVLGVPALTAVATPLISIVPSAIVGGSQYLRAKVADWRVGLMVGGAGALLSAPGALAVNAVGGSTALLITAGVILYAATDTILLIRREKQQLVHHDAALAAETAAAAALPADSATPPAPPVVDAAADAPPAPIELTRPNVTKALGIGVAAGFYSGFLGLGGGFLIVPLLRRGLSMTQKQAVGTSLFSVAILAIPALITQVALGNVDWSVAGGLVLGVIPGAGLGARMMLRASDTTAKVAFAVLLVLLGVWLGVNELLFAA